MAEQAQELRIGPHPGQQERFLATPADIAIYGGAAGGGKTWALVFEAARFAHLKGYTGVIFRREYPQLLGGGGIWDESQELYPMLGAVGREAPNLDWRFPSGARVEFRHLQHEKDKLKHQGRQYAFIGFDELTHFSEGQFWYLVSRLRTTCGVRPYMRATCNPDPDSFVRKLIEWWIGEDGRPIPERDGALRWFVRDGDAIVWGDTREELAEQYPEHEPLSLTFVRGALQDNPTLMHKDPGYRSRLMALSRVDRERLLGENWDIRPAAGNFFRRGWFRVVETMDELPARPVRTVRAWDKAATEKSEQNPDPDWTRGAKVARLDNGDFAILHMEGTRSTPGKVEELVYNSAVADGIKVVVCLWQDPGQAGKYDVDRMRRVLTGYPVRVAQAAKNKQEYAETWSPLVEQGRVYVLRGAWNEALFGEAEAFPDGAHDDQIDALSRAFLELTSGGAHRLKHAMDRVRNG